MRHSAWIMGLLLICLCAFVAPMPAQESGKETWQPLFDGKETSAFDEPVDTTGEWTLAEGALLEGRGGGPGNPAVLVSKEEFANLRLRVEFCYPEVGGGGIELRRTGEGNVTSSYFVSSSIPSYRHGGGRSPGNILKLRNQRYGTAHPPLRRSAKLDIRPGEWHTLEIVASGNRIATFLDGRPSDDYRDNKKVYASGRIGIVCTGDSKLLIRSIAVQKLPD